MMQLYDQEEIMRIHDIRVARDASIQTAVETYQEFGLPFADAVDKIANKFSMSYERAEDEAREYWSN